MTAYLMIQNPGVAPEESFTLLGASTKRKSDNSSTIGKFGTGNKHGVAVLLRNRLAPVVFAGNLKLEFSTRVQEVNDGLGNHQFNRVVVKYGGKDRTGTNRSSTEDLGFVLEHGSDDWLSVDLALREFISNSIDRAVEEGEHRFVNSYVHHLGSVFAEQVRQYYQPALDECNEALKRYRLAATDYKNVVVEIVNENQVRAKSDHTRIFIPMTAEVFQFYNDLGKWFLHFSEPELLNKTILPKSNRNLGNRQSAVIYRRGVRVREFESSNVPSLFDYNLENLKLDESRRVDDWYVQHEAAKAVSNADVKTITRLWQSFIDGSKFWEHDFQSYGLEAEANNKKQNDIWLEAFEQVCGELAVLSTDEGGKVAERKGYNVVVAPMPFVQAAEKRGLPTPSTVLSDDDKLGRTIMDSTLAADAAVTFAWNLIVKHNLTNGKQKPNVKTFRKIMDAGSQTLGFYKNDTVYINQDIAPEGSMTLGWNGLTQQLLATALEEVTHHVTGATDNSRDFQDFLLNLVVYSAKEKTGL
jgi:hypothetical protein